MKPTDTSSPEWRPERWQLQAGDAATATLIIPADAKRERRFEIACAATVAVPQAPAPASLQMTVLADGAQQWRRRVLAQNPGEFDGLDYRFSRSVPVGRPLRVTVNIAVQGARRRTLHIEADEI
jgi:hypothetical protein